MILIFESGNTITNIVVRDDNEVKFSYKVLDSQLKTDQDFYDVLNQLFEFNNFDVKQIDIVLISSVVKKLEKFEENYCKVNSLKFLNIKNKNVKLNFNKIDGLGSDLVANIFNVVELYKQNIIVIDMGTATTFSVIDEKGKLIGCSFVAGVKTMLDVLSSKCDLLPKTDIKWPDSAISNTTIGAMQSGLYFGYIGILKEIVQNITNELNNKDMKVIMTGGYSKIFIDKLDFVTQYIPELTTDGIYKIYKFNENSIK